MRDKIKKLLEKQQAIHDRAKAESRDLTDEEQREFDGYQNEIDQLQKQVNQPAQPSADPAGDGVSAERKRAADITAICRDFGIDAGKYIEGGSTVDEVRAAILEQMRKDHPPVQTGVHVTDDESDKFRAAAADAMILRSGLTIDKPAPGAQDLRAMSLRDMAIECLRLDGEDNASVRMDNEALLNTLSRQFFNPSAAFPSIMDQTIKKAYVAGYDTAGTTFDQWVSTGSLSDFKESQAGYLAGAAGELRLVPENGELEADVPTDRLQPTRKINTYGRQFSMSRQAFINDDIGYLTTIPARYAASARRTINSQVYGVLTGNPVIYDGVQLFHATHENLITSGTDLTVEAVQAAIIKMRLARDLDGNRINIRPKYLIVPVGYEFKAQAILSATTVIKSSTTESGNPLSGMGIEVISDVALNDAAVKASDPAPWYLVADRASVRGIQVDYLNGQTIPTISRAETPGRLGYVWDIYLDWGVSVLDYRGLVKNPGIALSY